MKRQLDRIYMLLAAVLTMGLYACSDEEGVEKTPLDELNVTVGEKTVSTLAFSWQAVDDATQYAYELKNMEGLLQAGGMTGGTSVTITGLKVNTAYEFRVWAYAAVTGHRGTSPVTTLKVSTNDVCQLSTPQVTWEQTAAGILLTWTEVSHADYYRVTYTTGTEDDDKQETITYTNSCTIAGLPIGEYPVSVTSCTEDENYTESTPATLTVERTKMVVWSKPCTYESEALGTTTSCTLVNYEDGSYQIQGLFGSTDYLEFSVDYDHVNDGTPEIVLSNSYSATPPYYYFHAGDYILCAYQQTGSGYTGWEGDTSEPGVWFYVYVYDKANNYLGAGFDYITWEEGE